MARADDIRFQVGANAAGFRGAMAQVQQASERTGTGMMRAFSRAETAIGGVLAGLNPLNALLGALAAGLSADGLRRTVADVAALGDASERLGLSVENLQEWQFAAERSGASADAMTRALDAFSRKVGDAASGGAKDFVAVLNANGVALRDAEGKLRPLNDLLRDYASLVSNASDQATKAELATRAFGGAGNDIIGVLDKGAQGFDKMAREAARLGVILEKDTVQSAQALDEKFNAILDRMYRNWQRLVVSVAEGSGSIANALSPENLTGGKGAAQERLAGQADALRERIARMTAELASPEAANFPPVFLERHRERLDKLKAELAEIENLSARIDVQEGIVFGGSGPTTRGGRRRNRTTVVPSESAGGGGGGGGGANAIDREAEAEARRAERIREVIAALDREYAALNQTNEQKRIAATLAQLNIDAGSEEGQAIASRITMIEAEKRAIDRVAQAREESERRHAEVAQGVSDFVGGMVRDLRQGASAADAMNNALSRLADQALNVALNAIFGGGSGGFGGGFGGGFRLPGRAFGGPVLPNMAYLVGERGPEIFKPSMAGNISPMANRQASNNVQVQVINNAGASVSTSGTGTAGDPLKIIVDQASKAVGSRYGLRLPATGV